MTEPGLATPAATTGTGIGTATTDTATTDTANTGTAHTGTAHTDPANTDTAPRATRWMQRLAEETSPTPADDGAATALDDADVDLEDAEPEPGRPLSSGLLLLLGLIWLAATMWSAHASIADGAFNEAVVISLTALALPLVIAASLLAGAAAGLAGGGRFARGGGAVRRTGVGIASGAVTGLAAAGVILFAYGARPAVAVLAITVGGAGALGGAAAGLRAPTLAAGIVATLGVFVMGVVLNNFRSPIKSFFGAGDTADSQWVAANWLSFITAAAGGLVAGLLAHFYLRRHDAKARWPGYLLAGATPGLLLLLTEGLTRLGGARLLDLVGSLSEGDRDGVAWVDAARINQALVVGFLGGIVAMIAVGRRLRRPEAEPGTDESTTESSGGPSGGAANEA